MKAMLLPSSLSFPFLSLALSSHVVQAPLQGVRPSPDARGVPRERRLGRAVLEQARADEGVEGSIGRRRGIAVLGAALPPPEDLAASCEGHDSVEHGGECGKRGKEKKEREREREKKRVRKKEQAFDPSKRFFFASVSPSIILFLFSPSSTLQRYTRHIFYSPIHAPLTIARTAASNLGESIAC